MNRRKMITGSLAVASAMTVPVAASALVGNTAHAGFHFSEISEADELVGSHFHYLIAFNQQIEGQPRRFAGIRFDEDGRMIYEGNLPPDEASAMFLQNIADSGFGQSWLNGQRVA